MSAPDSAPQSAPMIPLAHGAVTATARRHGISRSLLTRWRREFREGLLRAEGRPGFTPLQIAPEVPPPSPTKACRSQSGQDRVEVVLTNGRHLVVGTDVGLERLVRLVQVLERA